jgi:DNA gyrase subunit A
MKVHKINKKTGDLVKALLVDEKEPKKEILIASLKGQVLRIPLKSIPLLGRVSQGVRLIRFKEKDDKVKAVTLI